MCGNRLVPLSKFAVYWTRADINRKVQEINLTSQAAFSDAVTGTTPTVGNAAYYQRLLLARSARDELRDGSGGGARRKFLSIRK